MLPQAQAELVYWEIDQFAVFVWCDQANGDCLQRPCSNEETPQTHVQVYA